MVADNNFLVEVSDKSLLFEDRIPGWYYDGEQNTVFVIPRENIPRTDAPNITQFCINVGLLEEKVIRFLNFIKRYRITDNNRDKLIDYYQSCSTKVQNIYAELNRIHAHPEVASYQKHIAACKTKCLFILMKEITFKLRPILN